MKASLIAVRLGASRQSVNRWLRAARRRGRKALAARPAPGRPAKLTPTQLGQLRRLLIRGALAAGYATNLWTCPRIAKTIGQRFGVHYHVDYLPRLLDALGFSCQKPESTASERDEEAIRGWIARDWPRIKKTPPAGAPTSSSSMKPAS
jgi:transposase